VQGFALGGEIRSATVYMVEAGGIARRGTSAGYQGVCQGIALSMGSLVGLGLSLVLSDAELAAYGWRIALLLGVTIVPVALFMRRTLPETHGTPEPEIAGDNPGPSYRQIVALGLAIIGSGTIGSYITNYIATFGQTQLNLSVSQSMMGQLAGNLMIIIASMIGGTMSDRFGRRPLIVLPTLALTLAIVPTFSWIVASHSVSVLIMGSMILAFLLNFANGPIYAAIAESLPPKARSRGFAMIYSLPVAILGGTTQLFVTWLLHVTGNPMSIAWYLTGVTALGLIAMILLPESAPAKRGWTPALAT
jgi:MFS family permease